MTNVWLVGVATHQPSQTCADTRAPSLLLPPPPSRPPCDLRAVGLPQGHSCCLSSGTRDTQRALEGGGSRKSTAAARGHGATASPERQRPSHSLP